jgi:hypothetical protein
MKRVMTMAASARYYSPSKSNDKTVLYLFNQTARALNFWLDGDYQNGNWWYNDIGVPQAMACVLLSLDDSTKSKIVNVSLPASSYSKGKMIVDRANWVNTPKGTWTGANLADYVIATVTRGCIFENKTTVRNAFSRMWQEVKVSHVSEDNIQRDSSFHQHSGGGRGSLLAGSYGAVFTSDVLHLSAMSANTSFCIPQDKLTIFTQLLLDGQQWMTTCKGTWDYSVVGRSNSAPSSHRVGFDSSEMRNLPVSPHRQAELYNYAQLMDQSRTQGEDLLTESAKWRDQWQDQGNHGQQGIWGPLVESIEPPAPLVESIEPPAHQGSWKPLVGNRAFWDSDYAVHKRANFMVSVRMYSKRTIAARCVNEQGRKNFRSADGVTNLWTSNWSSTAGDKGSTAGDEYFGIEPTWSFHDLNGMTNEIEVPLAPCNSTMAYNVWPLLMNYTTFVGSVSDLTYGASAMNLSSGTLRMHNGWFYLDDGYAHLGAGITCSSGSILRTTLANRLLGKDARVTVGAAGSPGGSPQVLPHGSHTFDVAPDGTGSSSDSSPLMKWAHLGYPSEAAATDPLGIAYLPLLNFSSSGLAPSRPTAPSGGVFHLANMNSSGDWGKLGTSSGNVTRETFQLGWEHGRCVAGAQVKKSAFAYRVVVGARPSELAGKPNIVVANNKSAQAVFDRNAAMLQAIMWKPGVLRVAAGWNLAVSASCMVVVRELPKAAADAELILQVTVSNPEGVLGLIISVDRQLFGSNCTYNPAANRTSFLFALRGGDWTGQSRTLTCATKTVSSQMRGAHGLQERWPPGSQRGRGDQEAEGTPGGGGAPSPPNSAAGLGQVLLLHRS